MTGAEQTQSCWTLTQRPTFSSLRDNLSTDVCVVGAGIAGLTTAYLLLRSGKRVIVLDKDEIGAGETSRSTAHITNALDDRYFNLEKIHGTRGAQLAAESHTAAIDLIEAIAETESIACDFIRVNGYLFAAPDSPSDILERELEACQRAGLTQVHLAEQAPVQLLPGPCLLFPRQAQFHPIKYLAGLAAAIVRQGGKIFTYSHVTATENNAKNNAPDGTERVTVSTASGGKVVASSLVVATNTPVNDVVVMHTKQAPYRSYVIGIDVPRGSVKPGLYWDTADPYHYVRLDGPSGDIRELLLVGGEDHKTGQADDGAARFTQLEQWTRAHFPQAGEVRFRWSGQVLEPVDGLAFIGRNPLDKKNIYIATGDSGNGITHGTIAGLLLTDLINNRPNAWEELYAPNRKSLRALGEFARENFNVAEQFADWLTPGDYASAEEIPSGSGGLVRKGAEKLAIFRDDGGVLHTCKATCPHLGCIVAWNDSERSWDCPCHGSRFTGTGDVISGPSKAGLEKINP